jgi:uncharacterized protein YndB with AHSA1/START domain
VDGAADEERWSSLELRRLLSAPAEDVFAAWTDPALMERWMSPVGQVEADVDLRVGGGFRLVMIGNDQRIEHTGEYLEIAPNRRLVFTWQSPFTGPSPSVVTVDLRPTKDGTELVLTHERLPDDQVEPHTGGWGRMLERLAEQMER